MSFLSFFLIGNLIVELNNQDPPDWNEILTFFRGSELQNFFTKILEDHLKAVIKPQYVDQIPKAVKVNNNSNQLAQNEFLKQTRSISGSSRRSLTEAL